MDSTKYIGMDVHKEMISIAVLNSSGKLVIESILETKARAGGHAFKTSLNLRVHYPSRFSRGGWSLIESSVFGARDRRGSVLSS